MSFEVSVSRRLGATTIALEFASGAPVTALVGPSGAGKTSLLNMIAGILRPDEGRIRVGGRVLFDAASRIDLPPEARACGYVFQDDRLFPHLNVRANLLYGHRLARPEARLADYDEVVDLLGIAHLAERRPRTLSGGEARRVAIGRALLAGPAMLLLDEPLTSLDADRRGEMLRTLERVRDHFSRPILYVSHQQEEVRRIAGAVVTMTLPSHCD
jgi:molybdate transport system ATP-binding protein